MSFKDLNLMSSYSSSRSNIVKEFYVPVLSESVQYDRITGFFNSYSLALVARGLKKFIKNGGKMRLLCGAELSEEDLNSILNASEISDKLSDGFLKDINSIFDEIEFNHLKLLAWMINENILEIKIGIVKNENGYVGGMLHEKTGILLDSENNTIVFSGSNNETGFGWSSGGYGNIEKFKVFSSWEDYKFIVDDLNNFEEDWNNKNDYLEVIDVPKAARDGLIKLAPNNLDEVMSLPLSYNEKSSNTRILRDYQEEAISKWQDNYRKGILEMATGTGKTFTALNCIYQVLKEDSKLLTVIACPYAHLVEQWAKDVEDFLDVKCYNIYSSANSKWKKDLSSLIFKLDLGIVENAIILTTHNTFSSDFFIDEINSLDMKSLIVVDEVHHVSSNSFKKGLLDNYCYRLGLSATPYIYNDEDATENLLNFFDGVVFSFGLDKALISYNDKGETYLTPYDYHPVKVNLNKLELKEYYDLSKRIARLYYADKNESDSFKNLVILRKNIINDAKGKLDCLCKLLDSFENINHLIIFCSSKQLNPVLDILREKGINAHKFTQDEGTKKSDNFGGLSHREFLVNKFDEGFYKALVAIKCLDEGVDIPSADKVIIMSSSNNPREYIQRRGRVLRRYDGKQKADIFDMAVINKDSSGSLIESIVDPERIRLMDFINSSDNPGYCMDLLEKWGVIL